MNREQVVKAYWIAEQRDKVRAAMKAIRKDGAEIGVIGRTERIALDEFERGHIEDVFIDVIRRLTLELRELGLNEDAPNGWPLAWSAEDAEEDEKP